MVKLLNFPELRQSYNWDCGAVSIEGILAYYGIDVGESDVLHVSKSNKKIGTQVKGIKKVARKYKIKFNEKNMNTNYLKKCIDKNHPVLIAIQAWKENIQKWKGEWNSGHYVIVIGYDNKKFYFADPLCDTARTYLTYKELEDRWHDLDLQRNKKKLIKWVMEFYGKKPKYNLKKAVHMDYDSYNKVKHTYKKYIKLR